MTDGKIKKMKTSSIIAALLCMVIGIVMIIYPGRSLDVICQAFGAVLIVGGMVCIIFFLKDVHSIANVITLIGGVIFAAVGIWIFTKPQGLQAIIPFIAGIIIVINGIFNCAQTVELGKAKFGKWWVSLILSALTIVLGVLLVINPFGAAQAIARIIGVFMVYDAFSDLWIIADLNKAYKDIKQEAEALDTTADVKDAADKEQ